MWQGTSFLPALTVHSQDVARIGLMFSKKSQEVNAEKRDQRGEEGEQVKEEDD